MKIIWKGAISFGLVNIPVKIFSAVESNQIDLDMLDERDYSNIRYKRVNETTGKEVPYENIVKGYKYNDEYVVLDDKDFEKANVKKTNLIEIISFVKESEIDPMYYKKPYYLEPDKSSAKVYAIMREALASSKKAGIASFVLRKRESLAAISPRNDVLVLNRIRFEEEIRKADQLNLPAAKTRLKGKELDLAKTLINQLTEEFDISKYKDTYRKDLMKIIEAKAKGKRVPAKRKLKVVHTRSKDIMTVLKKSIEQARKAS